MSKRMLCSDGKIISPRSNVISKSLSLKPIQCFLIFQIRFKGTVKFAPLSMHLGKDSSFKEDLESWMYMVADMINKTKLPWSLEQDLGNIERHKQEVFANPYSLFKDQEVTYKKLF